MLTPEQKLCKEAGRQLRDELEQKGIATTGFGVGEDANGFPAIRLMLLDKPAAGSIPEFYQGYKVESVITGRITAQ